MSQDKDARVRVLEKRVQSLCEDWAHDHTELQKRCLAAGATETEVYGDEWATPGILDLVDLLISKQTRALEGILALEPCMHEGGYFYPMCDGDGEPIGEQWTDPATVIQAMVHTARTALSR